jgi:polyisoprenyl-phosphate glycosyltransferase
MKKISIIIQCFNEEANIAETYNQLSAIIRNIHKYSFEIIFVDNGSADNTRVKIESITKKDKRVVGIALSRNFGPEASGLAGMEYSKSDAIITCPCDLQEPIEYIPKFIKEWENGNDLVIGIYTQTQDVVWMMWIRKFYYSLLKLISDIDIPVNSSGIALLNASALKAFLSLQEHYRSSVGLRAWIGFKTKYIVYERRNRKHGISSYNFLRYLETAERGLIGFSFLPLDIIIYIALTIFLLAFVFLIGYLLALFMHLIGWNQSTVIITVISLFGGLQLLAISAVGKYIQVIVEETKHRPHYIIEKIFKK